MGFSKYSDEHILIKSKFVRKILKRVWIIPYRVAMLLWGTYAIDDALHESELESLLVNHSSLALSAGVCFAGVNFP